MDAGFKNNNIWEEAVKERNKQPQAASLQRILIVLGNPSVGIFIENQENLRS